MDDSLWTWWPMALFGDLGEVGLFVLVVGLLLLRVLPSTRRWAPRGSVRRVRHGSATRSPSSTPALHR